MTKDTGFGARMAAIRQKVAYKYKAERDTRCRACNMPLSAHESGYCSECTAEINADLDDWVGECAAR